MKTLVPIFLFMPLLGCVNQSVRTHEQVVNMGDKAVSMVKLDDNRFKIGNILVDKRERYFEVTGKFIRTEPPIEFLAVAQGGDRGYESLLELNVNVYEFNLACILIGLDAHKGTPPSMHFDPKPVEGDAVEISLSWETNGKAYQYDASDFFQFDDKKLTPGEWVYTGSRFLPEGKYLPEVSGGTLIGFVHDPGSIIEHRYGFGDGSYSRLTLNPALIPPENTPLKVHFNYAGNTLDQ